MNCHEAQSLLEQGVLPGSASAQRAQLGFHLAGCPACRAFRRRYDSSATHLLADLLLAPVAGGPPQAQADPLLSELLLRPPARRAAPPCWRQALRYALLGLLVFAALGGALTLGQIALAVFSIRQNVRSMIVTPLPAPTLLPTSFAAGGTGTDLVMPNLPLITPTHISAIPQPAANAEAPPQPGQAVTILLLGSDLRLDEEGPARTDTIMLARVDPQRQRVALLSLTRDLIVDIPGYGEDRINAANVYGGIELTRQTVSNLLRIPIDYYAYVDFRGFIGAVDAIGGITVNVDKEVYEPGWDLHLLPGPQQMDGLTALRYSRIRSVDSDYDRVKRQQGVLLAIAARLREQKGLASLRRLAGVTSALRGYVQTDMTEDRLLGLAWALRNLAPESVERYSVEGYMVSTGVVPGDQYAQVPNPGVIEELTRGFLGPDAP